MSGFRADYKLTNDPITEWIMDIIFEADSRLSVQGILRVLLTQKYLVVFCPEPLEYGVNQSIPALFEYTFVLPFSPDLQTPFFCSFSY